MGLGMTGTGKTQTYGGEEMPLSAARCKPDYEGMITRAKKKQEAANALREAAIEYMKHDRDFRRGDGVLTMIGYLTVREDETAQKIQRLMAEQEADKSA